jgi:serine protease Do
MYNFKDNGIVFTAVCVITLLTSLFLGVVQSSYATESVLQVTSSGVTDIQSAIMQVADDVGKSVVSISTEIIRRSPRIRRYYFGTPFGEEEPFDEFFGDFFKDFFGDLPQQRQMGLGSGVIIDERGYVLTNEHVVADADKITVTLPDGREFKGELMGSDPRSDLAIIKIKAKNLPVAKLGKSDNLKIGQWVVAIGNPFGFYLHSPEPTVTVGVISALHRSLPRTTRRDRDYSDLIQTDAAINPGNSGGPLVNLQGEVIGINVAIFSTSGGYQGIGFAIPVNVAERIIGKLIEGKKVTYGWLGINIQNLNQDLAEYFGLVQTKGIIVAKVLPGSPADKAGIKSGDVITSFDGRPVKNTRELLSAVGQTEEGKTVSVGIRRKNRNIKVKVTVGARPEDINELYSYAQESTGLHWRGIEVSDITAQLQRKFRLRDNEGVVIVSIDPDSPAAESDLSVGDIIDEINTRPVRNTQDFRDITKDTQGKALVRTKRGYFVVREK